MRFIFLLFILFLVSCQTGGNSSKTIEMYNASGDMVGTATLTEQEDGIQIKLKVEGLTPGFHGIHIHEYPECKVPDFISAGNHFNPQGDEHGLMHPEGAHLGDLPNVEADGDGLVDAELMLAEATLLDGKNSILEGGGTSLIIHENQDDGVSQPAGDSGIRIICGEIIADDATEATESPTDPTQFNEDQED
ncbi:superoxide dismutase family protein [Virgibacillus sp. C22-A2]|uniref:Superoxide dismutase family protein n=1 Tax=Virgibacillus tibetensis TaxID=3042313 RepID=A0ABU6KID2_9BACI|nr:superoxide dismutase family protein [Virgibacillus sp. C22-A2]